MNTYLLKFLAILLMGVLVDCSTYSVVEDRLQKLESQAIEANLDIELLKTDNEFTKSELSDLKHEDHVNKINLSELRKELGELTSNELQIAAELAQLKKDRDSDRLKIEELNNKLNQVQTDNQDMKAELASLKIDNQHLQANVVSLESGNVQLNASIAEIINENEQAKTELFNLKSDVSQLKSTVASLNSSIVQLKSNVDELLKQNEELKASVAGLSNENLNINRELASSNNRIGALENEMANLRNQFGSVSQQVKDLGNKVNNCCSSGPSPIPTPGPVPTPSPSTTMVINTGSGQIYTLALIQNERFVVSSHENGIVRVWNLQNGGQLHRTISEAQSFRWNLLTEGNELFLGLENSMNFTIKPIKMGEVRIYDANQLTLLRSFKTDTGGLTTMKINDFNRNELLTGTNGPIKVWNYKNGQGIKTLSRNFGAPYIRSLAFISATVLAAGADSRVIEIWNYQTANLMKQLQGHQNMAEQVYYDSRFGLISAGKEGAIRKWNVDTGSSEELAGERHNGQIVALVYGGPKQYMYSFAVDNTFKAWNMQTRSLVRTQKMDHWSFKMLITKSNSLITGGSQDGKIYIRPVE